MLSYLSCSFCQILKNFSTSFSSFSESSRFSRSGNVADTRTVSHWTVVPRLPAHSHYHTHTHRLAVASTWLEVEFGWRFSNTVALLHFMHSSVRTQPAASSLLFKGDGNICLVVVFCCCWSSHCLNLTKGKGTSSLEVKQTVALPKTIWLASCVYSVPVKTAFSVFMLVHVVICLELHEVFHLPFMYFSDSTDLKLDLWRWFQGHCYSNLPVFFNRCTCFMNLKDLCCTDLELSWPCGPPACLSLAG